MTYNIYAIYDRAAYFIKKPFVCDHDVDAVRAFLTCASNFVDNPPNAADFSLIKIGQLDSTMITSEGGERVSFDRPSPSCFVEIASGAQLVAEAVRLRNGDYIDDSDL